MSDHKTDKIVGCGCVVCAPAFERPMPTRANLNPWPWGRLSQSAERRPSEEEHFRDYRSSKTREWGPFPRWRERPWSLTRRDISGVSFGAPPSHSLIFGRACQNNVASFKLENKIIYPISYGAAITTRFMVVYTQNWYLSSIMANRDVFYSSRTKIDFRHQSKKMSIAGFCFKNGVEKNESWIALLFSLHLIETRRE